MLNLVNGRRLTCKLHKSRKSRTLKVKSYKNKRNRKLYISTDNYSYHMITKDNNLKVMKIFFKNPNKTFHIRELSRLTNLSSTGIIKIVKRLKKEDLLVSKRDKITEEVKPAFNDKFYLIKKMYNLYSLYESDLIDYLKKFYEEPKAIILFGSYSKGLDTEMSDIDICVLTSKIDLPDLGDFEKRLNRKINIINSDGNNMKKEFKNSLANGLVIEGYMELIK